MTWQPLWNDAPIIAVHVLAALVAMGAGALHFVMWKGTKGHLMLGYNWVGIMALVAGSSFWIHEFRVIGPYSPIHVLSAITFLALWYAVRAARGDRIRTHALRSLDGGFDEVRDVLSGRCIRSTRSISSSFESCCKSPQSMAVWIQKSGPVRRGWANT